MRLSLRTLCLALLVLPSTASSAPRVAEFGMDVPTFAMARAAAVGEPVTTAVLRPGRRFDLVGLRWRGTGELLGGRVRTRSGGRWSDWVPLGHGHGVRGSDPVWAGGADALHELLGASDYVVVVASLNSTTRHLVGEGEFSAMKPGAGFVNVARGGLVDQAALIAALDDGRVGGAVLDVVTPQPLPSDSPLWAHPRVIVTPHISGGSPEGWARSMELFGKNLPLYLDGHTGRLGNVVNLADHL